MDGPCLKCKEACLMAGNTGSLTCARNTTPEITTPKHKTSSVPLNKIVSLSKWHKLYHSVNSMMAELGAEGEICANDDLPSEVMSVLHDLDGGVYDPGLGN